MHRNPKIAYFSKTFRGGEATVHAQEVNQQITRKLEKPVKKDPKKNPQ